MIDPGNDPSSSAQNGNGSSELAPSLASRFKRVFLLRLDSNSGSVCHFLLRASYVCALIVSIALPAFSQFPTAKVSLREWGIKDPNRIMIAQVSVMKGKSGDSLLIYALRDTIPPHRPSRILGKIPYGRGSYFVISDFDYSPINSLGGVFGSFQKEPSSSSAKLADTKDKDRALRLGFNKEKEGYCGMWIRLFNSFDPPESRVYLDSKPFSVLTFWIRGENGGEHLTLKVADARWVQKEDALTIGDVGNFIPGGRIDTIWRQAVISMNRIPVSINRAQLGILAFAVDSLASGQVELKTLALCEDSMHMPPFARASAPGSLGGSRKAIWVWNTKTIDESPEARNQLVHFLVEHDFTEVFLAIPYESGEATKSGSLTFTHGVFDSLLVALHARNIRVDALLGDKSFTLPEWHAYVVSTVKNIELFNAESSSSQRFDGIHLDIEPYLLPGFNGPRHQELLKDYLELLSEVCMQAHSTNLTVGADIPFWYGEPDEFTHDVTTIRFHETEKPVYQHILDMVDNVAVMSYRTTSSGVDGVIAHSLDEIVYAQKAGKTAFIGLETGPLSDERIVTFQGKPQVGELTSSQGEHLYLIPSGDILAFYLVPGSQSSDFAAVLRSASIDRQQAYQWSTNKSVALLGARLSFATVGIEEFNRTMKETLLEFSQYKSFAGFAIHHYDSYKSLLDSSTR